MSHISHNSKGEMFPSMERKDSLNYIRENLEKELIEDGAITTDPSFKENLVCVKHHKDFTFLTYFPSESILSFFLTYHSHIYDKRNWYIYPNIDKSIEYTNEYEKKKRGRFYTPIEK